MWNLTQNNKKEVCLQYNQTKKYNYLNFSVLLGGGHSKCCWRGGRRGQKEPRHSDNVERAGETASRNQPQCSGQNWNQNKIVKLWKSIFVDI